MKPNFLIPLLAALVPLVIGFIWYNPKVFGKAWMNASGMTEEKAEGANMAVIFGLTFVFSVLLAFSILPMVIHQFGVSGLFMMKPDFQTPGSESSTLWAKFVEVFGKDYRTFKHGAFHGALAGFTIALPILGVNALFERKGFKYIAINAGFWIVSMSIMGGIICAFS